MDVLAEMLNAMDPANKEVYFQFSSLEAEVNLFFLSCKIPCRVILMIIFFVKLIDVELIVGCLDLVNLGLVMTKTMLKLTTLFVDSSQPVNLNMLLTCGILSSISGPNTCPYEILVPGFEQKNCCCSDTTSQCLPKTHLKP